MTSTSKYDAAAGKIARRECAEHCRTVQAHPPSTVEQVARSLTFHDCPTLSDRPLASILPSDLKGLVATVLLTLAPATVSVIYRHLSAVLKATVGDCRIDFLLRQVVVDALAAHLAALPPGRRTAWCSRPPPGGRSDAPTGAT